MNANLKLLSEILDKVPPEFVLVERSKLDAFRCELEDYRSALENIAFTEEGNRVVGVSRSGAIRNFYRQLHMALFTLSKYPRLRRIRDATKEDCNSAPC